MRNYGVLAHTLRVHYIQWNGRSLTGIIQVVSRLRSLFVRSWKSPRAPLLSGDTLPFSKFCSRILFVLSQRVSPISFVARSVGSLKFFWHLSHVPTK